MSSKSIKNVKSQFVAAMVAVFDSASSTESNAARIMVHAYLDGAERAYVAETVAGLAKSHGTGMKWASEFNRVTALPREEVKAIANAYDATQWVGFTTIIKAYDVPSISTKGRKPRVTSVGTEATKSGEPTKAETAHAGTLMGLKQSLQALRADATRATADMAFLAQFDDLIATANMLLKRADEKAQGMMKATTQPVTTAVH